MLFSCCKLDITNDKENTFEEVNNKKTMEFEVEERIQNKNTKFLISCFCVF